MCHLNLYDRAAFCVICRYGFDKISVKLMIVSEAVDPSAV